MEMKADQCGWNTENEERVEGEKDAEVSWAQIIMNHSNGMEFSTVYSFAVSIKGIYIMLS